MSEVFSVSERYILYGEDGELKELTHDQREWLERIDRLTPEQRILALSILDQFISQAR